MATMNVIVLKEQLPTGTREPTLLEKTQWVRYGPDAVKWNLEDSPDLIARHVFGIDDPDVIKSWKTNKKTLGQLVLERRQGNTFELGGNRDNLIVLIIFRNLLSELKNLGIAARSINHTGDWSRLRQVGKIIWQLVTRGRFYDAVKDQPLLAFIDTYGNFQTFSDFKKTTLDPKYGESIMGAMLNIVGSLAGPGLDVDTVMGQLNAIIYTNSLERQGRIPLGLAPDEEVVYHVLRKVHQNRASKGVGPRHVLIVSDLGKDLDDLIALVLLKELHRLGFIVIEGVVANYDPPARRARFGRGALDQLGLAKVPVGVGFSADATKKAAGVLNHEFEVAEKTFSAPEGTLFPDGQDVIEDAFETAKKKGYKLSLLLISSLTDINTFAKSHGDLFKEVVSDVTLQGGYRIVNGELTMIPTAANNGFDIPSAEAFHRFLENNKIPSVVYTKTATFATEIYTAWLLRMEATGHILGRHLRDTQIKQETNFYTDVVEGRPFAPFMTQSWYLDNKTTWWAHHARGTPLPATVAEVLPYLNKILVYDGLAAIGVAGQDVLDAFDILDLEPAQNSSIHKFVGLETQMTPKVAAKPAVPEIRAANGLIVQQAKEAVAAVAPMLISDATLGLHPKEMALVIKALGVGSLLACTQGAYYAV